MKYILLVSFVGILFCVVDASDACEQPYQYFETFYKLLPNKHTVHHTIIDRLKVDGIYREPGATTLKSPLQCAFEWQNYTAMQQLVIAGFDAETTWHALSLLHEAVIQNDEKAVNILVQAGVDLNSTTRDKIQNTALHIAACMSYNKLVSLLIEAGACLDIKNSYGKTPLDYFMKEKIA